jgi:pimeloyl-ACP methyl ester carboxylesterase
MSSLAGFLALAVAGSVAAPIGVRGRTLEVRLYGDRGGSPVVLASGGALGAGLGSSAAAVLAADGYFVVALEARQYLSAFTARGGTLGEGDVAGDFATVVDFATGKGTSRPVLVGIAEGAGLATLAAADAVVKGAVRGVVAIDLRDRNDLAWRSPDWILCVVDESAEEPGFSVAAIVDRLAPLPLAQLQVRHGLVPLAEARRLHDLAGEPRRMWVIDPGDDPLPDDAGELARGLLEAMDWVARAGPR